MSVRIIEGDALTMLRTLESGSVQVCVTSPPYYALRDYGVAGQIGMEQTPGEFIDAIMAVFEEVRRVLRPDGLCFVNLGDSYAGSGKGPTGHNGIGDQEQRQGFVNGRGATTSLNWGSDPSSANNQQRSPAAPGIPAKNLLLIPERFAIAMQDRGWTVRSRIAWCKTSAMPESVRDRPTSAWEHIWMFSKSRTYYYDAEAVRQPARSTHPSGNGYARPERLSVGGRGQDKPWQVQPTSALRNYWLLGPAPSSLEHFASFPPEIPRRCILAGTSERGQCPACGSPWVRLVERKSVRELAAEVGYAPLDSKRANAGMRNKLSLSNNHGGIPQTSAVTTLGWAPSCQCDAGDPVPQTVLDPFLGSGTAAMVADRLGRDAVGIELSPTYAAMARRRIEQDAGSLFGETVESTTVEDQQLPLIEIAP